VPKLIVKSLVLGFMTGTVFLGLAPFGLGFSFVEFLRPILMPGIDLFQPLGRNIGGSLAMLLGLILNGLIYFIFFLSILTIQKYVVSRKMKVAAILCVVLVFLAITGMLSGVWHFMASQRI